MDLNKSWVIFVICSSFGCIFKILSDFSAWWLGEGRHGGIGIFFCGSAEYSRFLSEHLGEKRRHTAIFLGQNGASPVLGILCCVSQGCYFLEQFLVVNFKVTERFPEKFHCNESQGRSTVWKAQHGRRRRAGGVKDPGCGSSAFAILAVAALGSWFAWPGKMLFTCLSGFTCCLHLLR